MISLYWMLIGSATICYGYAAYVICVMVLSLFARIKNICAFVLNKRITIFAMRMMFCLHYQRGI